MKRKYILALSVLLIWGAVGCNKPTDFGDANTNPDAVTKPILTALLTNAQLSVVSYATTGGMAINGGLYGQYFSETQYPAVQLYASPATSFTGNYTGVLYDLQAVINLKQDNNATAVAKILQQYVFWCITDAWGDVPYSEALQGISAIKPKYDTQEDIYKGILKTLADAGAELNTSAPVPGDIFYGGVASKWKTFANSLRMIVSLQLSKKVPAASGYAATDFKAAMAAGYINTNADNFAITYPGGNYKSPWFGIYDGRKDFAESKTMTDLLGSLGDGRLQVFGGASEERDNVTASILGVPYGLKRDNILPFTDANTNWARILRGDFRTEKSTAVVLSAAEVSLAIAEAQNIGWITNGTTAYKDGITLSFQQWGLTVPAAYLTGLNVALSAGGTSADDLRKITLQRWVGSYPNGHMAWNIWRKSTPASSVPATPNIAYGTPLLLPAPDATNSSKQIVRRYTYSSTESINNGDNLKAAVARIPGGADSQDARVWWDQN